MRTAPLPAGLVSVGAAAVLAMGTRGQAAAAPLVEPLQIVRGTESGVPFNGPRGIAIDSARGEVLVSNTSAGRIEVFSFSGRRKAFFIHRVRAADGSEMNGLPAELALDHRGQLLVVDRLSDDVDVLDARGHSVGHLAISLQPGEGRPVSAAVARDGAIFVATGGDSGTVREFSSDHAPVAAWPRHTGAPGRLSRISALAVTPDDHVVVACPMGTENVIQIFTRDGTFVRGFGGRDISPGDLSLPSGIAVTDDGRIWVSDEIRQTVQVYSAGGLFLGAFGDFGPAGGSFLYPSALATDGREYLAVAERVGGRYQLLRILPLTDPGSTD